MNNHNIFVCPQQLLATIHEKCKQILAQLGDVRIEITYNSNYNEPDVTYMIDFEDEMVETSDLHEIQIDTVSPFKLTQMLVDELADLGPVCFKRGVSHLITIAAPPPECVVRDRYALPPLGEERTKLLLTNIRLLANHIFMNYAELWIIIRRNLANSDSHTADPDVHYYDLAEEPQWIEVATRDAIMTEYVLSRFFSNNPSFTVTKMGYLIDKNDDDDLWLKVVLH